MTGLSLFNMGFNYDQTSDHPWRLLRCVLRCVVFHFFIYFVYYYSTGRSWSFLFFNCRALGSPAYIMGLSLWKSTWHDVFFQAFSLRAIKSPVCQDCVEFLNETDQQWFGLITTAEISRIIIYSSTMTNTNEFRGIAFFIYLLSLVTVCKYNLFRDSAGCKHPIMMNPIWKLTPLGESQAGFHSGKRKNSYQVSFLTITQYTLSILFLSLC